LIRHLAEPYFLIIQKHIISFDSPRL
jgi:hypothetical protein